MDQDSFLQIAVYTIFLDMYSYEKSVVLIVGDEPLKYLETRCCRPMSFMVGASISFHEGKSLFSYTYEVVN